MLKWPFTQTISIWITKAGFAVKIIFFAGIAISDQFEHSSPIWPQLDFLKIGFNRIIGIDQVIIRIGR
jgi:hypothetical protein